MNLAALGVRRLGGGVSHSMGLFLVMGLGLTACGPQISSERAEMKADEGATQSYQEWCTGWQLNCPVVEPGKDAPLTAAQFKALTTVARGVLSSPSVFSLTRQELDAEGLKQALTALHLEDVYQDVQERLDARQWQSGGLESGALVSHHAAGSQLKTDAGLLWNLEPVQKVELIAEAIQLSGFGLSAEAAEEAPVLKGLSVAEDSSFSLELSDRAVQGVPQDFALDSLLLTFGLDLTMLDGKEIALPDLIAAGAPLVSWLNTSTRQIVLERAFFATAASEMGVLLPDDGMGQALGNLMSRLETMRTSSQAGTNLASVALVRGSTAKCDMNNGEIKMKFAAEFGIKRIYQPSASSLGIEFYGLEASAKKALGIPIKLKRVELSADKITILDVPIIGKVDLKLDDVTNPDQLTTLACGA
ncbi:hypothetical protein [Oligoflexus tunisiensis]|uniref:hypothetical protein n=1 Tax=Oligoflexus tunisiensis TaxID=708132 RepID=UPI00114CABCC|nr:hypothetical protein [Oligoflexus tunisiensis]